MIRAIIIDDETHCIEMLKWELDNQNTKVEVISNFNEPKEGLEYIQNNEIDILFLDIEMPGMSGFELLDKIGEINFSVIFTTAYDQFAIQAIKLSALDYLLKPINGEDLNKALEKYNAQKVSGNNQGQYDLLFDQLSKPERPSRMALMTQDGIELLEINDIVYIVADSNYSVIHYQNKKIIASKTLKHFESVLDNCNFIRIHHSYYANIQHISRFIKADGGQVQMSDDALLPVSRRRKDELLTALMNVQ